VEGRKDGEGGGRNQERRGGGESRAIRRNVKKDDPEETPKGSDEGQRPKEGRTEEAN
jgi:hypothetical protein